MDKSAKRWLEEMCTAPYGQEDYAKAVRAELRRLQRAYDELKEAYEDVCPTFEPPKRPKKSKKTGR